MGRLIVPVVATIIAGLWGFWKYNFANIFRFCMEMEMLGLGRGGLIVLGR